MSLALPATIHPPDTFQQAVISSDASSIRVLAPAGSGKTETLARRAGHQIEAGIFPHRILILTFDTQARASFQRALQRLGIPDNVEIRTLNAFGLRILSSLFPEERNRTGRTFHGSSEPLLRELIDQTDGGVLVELFGTLKSHLFDPRKLNKRDLSRWIEGHYSRLVPERFLTNHPESGKAFAAQLAREFVRYEESLNSRNQIDFEDQKLRTWALLEANPAAAERVRSRYDEVIVDEVQDINPLDQRLIELVARDANLLITGDDDQAIYGFRWASADYLIRPDKPFARTFSSYELRTNYRCPKTILERSSALIRHNRNRVAKHPESGVSEAGRILLLPSEEQLAGSRLLVGHIRDTVAANPDLSWGDFAILARRNQHLDEMQVQLITAGIPHVVKSGRDLIRTWTTALDLLNLSTDMRTSGLRKVTDFRPAIAAYTWFPKTVREGAINRFRDLPLNDVLAELATLQIPPTSLKRFQDAIALLLKQSTVTQELLTIEQRFLGIDTGERRGKKQAARDEDSAESSQDLPLELLREILSRGDSTREQAIERLRGFIDKAHDANQQSGPAVELATYHGAKGRQWHTVMLPWVSTGTVPDPLTRLDFGEIEAERRLFYVAMTRAANTLVVGHPSPTAKSSPSRFLIEAGLVEAAPAAPTNLPLPTSKAPSTSKTTRATTATSSATTRTRSAAQSRSTPARGTKAAKPKPTSAVLSVEEVGMHLERIKREGGQQVTYISGPELLFPLQLALLLEGIPYQIAPNHDLLYSRVFREVYRQMTKKPLRILKVVDEPSHPEYVRVYPALVGWLRHKSLDMPTAKAELDAAIATAIRQRKTKAVPGVRFQQADQHPS